MKKFRKIAIVLAGIWVYASALTQPLEKAWLAFGLIGTGTIIVAVGLGWLDSE